MDFEALVKAKFDEAYASSEHPKKFFLTENGRGVVDGGEMYNALLQDVLDVVQKAIVSILSVSPMPHITTPRKEAPPHNGGSRFFYCYDILS